MTTTIAVAGKGGVGKTTLAGMIIKYLTQNRSGAVLAIDADPSSNLNMVLGLDLEWTIGDIREGMLEEVKKSIVAGGAAMGTIRGGSKREYLDYEIRSTLTEGEKVDLIAMGKPEGQGCYCAVNHTLREIMDSLSHRYEYVVIDNEAGMEHLSRRTTRDVDHLIIVSDPSYRGIATVERIEKLSRDLEIGIKETYIVINRVMGPLSPSLNKLLDGLHSKLVGTIPSDNELMMFEMEGEPLINLGDDSPVYQAVEEIMKDILR